MGMFGQESPECIISDQWLWPSSKSCCPVVFVLGIIIWNSANNNKTRTRTSNTDWTGFNSNYATEDNKTTADEKQIRVLFTTHEFIYKLGKTPVCWNKFRLMAFEKCLNFVIVGGQGSLCLVV